MGTCFPVYIDISIPGHKTSEKYPLSSSTPFLALSSPDFKLFPEAQQSVPKTNILTSLPVFPGKAVKLLIVKFPFDMFSTL
jgi:hypothetical protein